MTVLYIIGGLLLIGLAVFFLDKREKMHYQIGEIAKSRQTIEETNKELDDVIMTLEELNEPLSKLNSFAKKVLSYKK